MSCSHQDLQHKLRGRNRRGRRRHNPGRKEGSYVWFEISEQSPLTNLVLVCGGGDETLARLIALGTGGLRTEALRSAMSANGTKRTWKPCWKMFAFEGKADIPPAPTNVRYRG